MSNRLTTRPKRYVKHRAQRFGKRMARRRRVQRRRVPIGKRVSRLARQVGRLSGSTKVIYYLGGTAGQYHLSPRSGVQRWDFGTTGVGSDNIVLARLSDITQGDDEHMRIGDEVFVQRLQWDIKLVWVGVGEALTAEAGDRYPFELHEDIRVMVVRDTDTTSTTAAWQQAPSIPDIFQGFGEVVGAAGTWNAGLGTIALHGTYKPSHIPGHIGSASVDRQSVRQREFEVLYDKTLRVKWLPEWGSVPLNTGEAADDIENQVAHNLMINVNIPVKRKIEYLQAATQATNEVKGNIYLYIFSSGTNMTGANWPTTGGTVGIPAISVAARHRVRMFFRDV